MASAFLRSLDSLQPGAERDAGAKAGSLNRLARLGLPVPPGVVLLATAYDAFLNDHGLRDDYTDLIRAVRDGSPEAEPKAAALTDQFATLPFPAGVEAGLDEAVAQLRGRRVAVRSSATVEDTATAAWAGQLQTCLNVDPADIPAKVRVAWSSLLLPRAIAYAQNRGIALEDARVAVILQEMVDASVSGVLFTADPVTHDRKRLFLEAVFGLGEALVGGLVTPDTYWLSKQPVAVIDKRPIPQAKQLTLAATEGIRELATSDATAEKLTADEVERLAEMGLAAEREWNCPLDIEWSKDAAGGLVLLQARPITTLRDAPDESGRAPHRRFAKSITRGWSLLFCEMWHEAYTREFYRQFGWGLSDLFYEGQQGVVRVYRSPDEFVTGMTSFVTRKLDSAPRWIEEQVIELLQMVESTSAWIETVSRTPLRDYASEELITIFDEFRDRNVRLSPRYVLMLWFPIRMESHPDREKYSAAIDAAVQARVDSHRVGGIADGFARRLAAEALRRVHGPEELARAMTGDMLRSALMDGEPLDLDELHAFGNLFLVTREGVLHEDVTSYCARQGFDIQAEDATRPDKDIAKGVPAYPGKARGRARVVRGQEDFSAFRDGDVLITAMTTPDFVLIMKRAAAIVTDEGGATSHAAILARELRKPTITGTLRATSMCSTGDLVEANADDGLFQRLPVGNRPPKRKPDIAIAATTTRVFVVEDDLATRREVIREFLRQGRDTNLQIPEEGNPGFALRGIRNLRAMDQSPDAVVVDLKLEGQPLSGAKLVEDLHKEGYPAERIFVFSTMATTASALDQTTRAKVFARLAAVGVSKARGNVFGKVRPGQEAAREQLADAAGTPQTIPEMVATVLERISALAQNAGSVEGGER